MTIMSKLQVKYNLTQYCYSKSLFKCPNNYLKTVADLPGLIPDSHKNKGLGITFLKHAERCAALIFIVDVSQDEPWVYLEILQHEVSQFNDRLNDRPMIVVANKIDLPEAEVSRN